MRDDLSAARGLINALIIEALAATIIYLLIK